MVTLPLLIALLSPPAADLARAKSLYQAGSAAYRQARYEVAVGALEGALKIVERPQLVFSLAQAYRLRFFVAGEEAHARRAVELYRRYLEMAPEGARRSHSTEHLGTLVPLVGKAPEPEPAADPKPARIIVSSVVTGATARVDGSEPRSIPSTFAVAEGKRRVVVEAPDHLPKALVVIAVPEAVVAVNLDPEPVPAALTVTGPEGAKVLVDGARVGVLPLRRALEVRAGQHTVAVLQDGRRPFMQGLSLDRGQSAQLEARLELTGQRLVAHTLSGAAVALAVGAGLSGGFMYAAEQDAEALQETFDGRGFTLAEQKRYQDLESERDELFALTVGLGIGAGVTLIGAGLLYLLEGDAEPSAPSYETTEPGLGLGLLSFPL